MEKEDTDEEREKNEAIKNRKQTSRRASKRKSTSKRQSTSRRQSRRQSRRKSRRQSSRGSTGSRRGSGKSKKHTITTINSAKDVVASLRDSDEFLESPIDLKRNDILITEIPALQWKNYQSNPLYLKITNTNKTVVLNGLYPEQYTPSLTGGPLEVPHKFAQFHFHWGENDEIGSEHRIEGEPYPLEGHMVLYKDQYEDLAAARAHEDGVIILVYMFQTSDTSDLMEFTKYLPKLKDPYSQIPITTVSLQSFFPELIDDYVLYFGNMSGSCNHGVLWLICRKTLGITQDELADFRKINAKPGLPIGNNFRDVKPLLDRNVYIVNAGERDRKMVLHPLPRSLNVGKSRASKKSKGFRRESRRVSRRGSRRGSRRESKRQSKSGSQRRQSQRRSVSRKK